MSIKSLSKLFSFILLMNWANEYPQSYCAVSICSLMCCRSVCSIKSGLTVYICAAGGVVFAVNDVAC